MSNKVSIYFAQDLDSLNWPKGYDQSLVRNYFASMMKEGATSFIENGQSQLALIKIGDTLLPLSINETEYSNSYVTSIYSFLTYAKEEMDRHRFKILRCVMQPFLRLLGLWFQKARINRTVTVNNYLLSTNLYDSLCEEDLQAIHSYLVKQYPTHSIIFRSLNHRTEKSTLKVLKKKLSYLTITSRSVYFFDPKIPLPGKKRWINASDNRLFAQDEITLMNHEDFEEADVARIKELYDLLYLKKYTSLNPQFTKKFFLNAIKTKCFNLSGIKYKGEIVAVVGYFIQNEVITTPFVGYDTSLPQSLGLYRMLMSIVIKQSVLQNRLYHMSSGVGFFKRQRGATQEIESMAIYVNHLRWFRRLPWKIFEYVVNLIARPLLKKYQL